MMKFSHWLVAAVLVVTGLFVFNTLAISQSRQANQQSQRRVAFEYATMTSQAIQENNGMVYTVTWNAGPQDVIGRSTVSVVDAMRRLSAQLGGASSARTNLSVLLNSVGDDGWRLVESNQSEFGTTRVFIRTSTN